MRLYLVRHAAVTVRHELPSAQWHLSPEGRAAAEALAEAPHWANVAAVYTSPEPKAIATAQRIAARHALPLRIAAELREVDRPWSEGDYRDDVRRYFAGDALPGWEPRDAATARIRGAIDAVVAETGGRDVAAVSHGLALTLYLSDLQRVEAAAAFALWQRIGFPDVAELEARGSQLEVVRAFGNAGTTEPPNL